MTTPPTPSTIVANAAADLSWQEDLYKHLHAHPELSGAEEQTAQRIEEELQRFPDWSVTTGTVGPSPLRSTAVMP